MLGIASVASAVALGMIGLLLMVHMGGHEFQLRLFLLGAYTEISTKVGEPDDPRESGPSRPG
jgi:predicted dehydrogenase